MTHEHTDHDVGQIVSLPLPDLRLRLVTYQQAEAETERLASRLVETFGKEARRLRYTAIPRGGLIVLGMLSYILDLDRDVLLTDGEGPLVVVDDCSITGARFGRLLQRIDDGEVIFAHLYSHPDLRANILQRESRVIACLASRDLGDLAPERYPDKGEYLAWRERWRSRLEGTRYWIGLPELVVFPWSEPDRPFWNPLTGRVEDHWRLAPPDRCLKNRARLGVPPRPDLRRRVRSPEWVAHCNREDRVVLCNIETEEVFGLEGVAAEMWRALAAYGDLDAVVEYLLELYDVEEPRLRHDLDTFLEVMVAKGLLQRIHEGDGEGS